MVLRCGREQLSVRDPVRAERLAAMLQLLDGRPAEAAVSGLGVHGLRDGIRILDALESAGMLVDAGMRGAEPSHVVPPLAALTDLAVDVVGGGALAALVAAEMTRAGARLTTEGSGLRMVCPDGPDLAMLEACNGYARKSGQPWMPAFRLADELIAGPVFEPDRPGCFQCFVLRWLGMARSMRSEMAYFRWLRSGGWREERLSSSERSLLSRHAVGLASEWCEAGLESQLSCVDLQTGERSLTRLWPHPDCDVCGGSGAATGGPSLWSGWQRAEAGPALERLGNRLEGCVDDRIGLVGRIDAVPLPTDVPGAASLVAKAGEFSTPHVTAATTESPNVCGGLDASDGIAHLLTIVEGLERYCGLFSRPPDVVAPYRDVADRAMLPPELPLFSAAQYRQPDFPFRPFDASEALSWMWGDSLTHGTRRLVPRSAVFYGPTDDLLVDECSSGVAAGTSAVDAANRAVLEMVERDAFMIFWLNRLSPPLVDLATLPGGFARSAAAELRSMGHEPMAVNVTTDLGIPVFLSIALRADGKYPALILGAGCDFAAERALDKAFRELLGAVRWQHVDPAWSPKPPKAPEDVRSLDDHHTFYSHPQWLPRASFLWSSPRVQRFGEVVLAGPRTSERPGEQLEDAVAILRRAGMEIIAVDLTTPDVAQTGIRVVRAVIPGLQPIGFGQHAARLGGRRLYTAPCRMGYRSTPLAEHELNRDPHCFP